MISKHFSITSLFILFFALHTFAQKKITTPIEGVYGKDYIIVNHVDWGPLDTIRDLHCGSKTYNGHQGTDFTIRNFKQMDSGVAVLAADTGTVTFIQDGLFDKETTSTISKGLGNYIAIAHSGKFYSYYGHLKKNSISVSVGDKVFPGQKIGEVGSSGNSTDPHLHFEWWFDSSVVIDPFIGPCGNSYSYWKNPSPYDTSFNMWTSGLYNDTLSIDTLRYEPEQTSFFFSEPNSFISYWSLMYGVRKGDKIRVDWRYETDTSSMSQFEITVPKDYWYYYYWTYIGVPSPQLTGKYKAVLTRNGIQVDEKKFEVHLVNVGLLEKQEIKMQFKEHQLMIKNAQGAHLVLYSLDGKQLAKRSMIQDEFKMDIRPYIGTTLIAHVVKDGQVLKQLKIQVN